MPDPLSHCDNQSPQLVSAEYGSGFQGSGGGLQAGLSAEQPAPGMPQTGPISYPPLAHMPALPENPWLQSLNQFSYMYHSLLSMQDLNGITTKVKDFQMNYREFIMAILKTSALEPRYHLMNTQCYWFVAIRLKASKCLIHNAQQETRKSIGGTWYQHVQDIKQLKAFWKWRLRRSLAFPAWHGDISMEMASFCADSPESWGNVNVEIHSGSSHFHSMGALAKLSRLEEEDGLLDNSLVSWSLAVTSSIVAVTWSVEMDKQAWQLGIVDWWLLGPWRWGVGKGILTIR
ncbi:hypothetical protein EDD15DRAFT_2203398 [Pisolithus albus]|nr:hypothetical protein EDD15DRAFT_2203398 [Pisolithus albus]